MLVHVEIPDMSLNLQDPLLRLTGIHPRQTGGPLFCQILTDFARGGRRANSTPGPARGSNYFVSNAAHRLFAAYVYCFVNLFYLVPGRSVSYSFLSQLS